MHLLRIAFLLFISLLLILPERTLALPADESCAEEGKHLKVLSWNIYMLPKMVVRKGKRDRAHAIVEELRKSDFDVIVFQEAFLPAARSIIGEGLKDMFPYQYGPANNSKSILTNSGVWVLSKTEMKVLDEIRFRQCATWDCYARKGAIMLEGVWNGKKFQLLGTHLQADGYDEIRQKQMNQIYIELLAEYREEGVPQLICGDLNTEQAMKEYYCEMLTCLDAEDGDMSSVEKHSYDGVNNEIAQSYGMKRKTTYDYILVRNNGAKMKSVKRFINILRKGKRNLSDHYGVVCEVRF